MNDKLRQLIQTIRRVMTPSGGLASRTVKSGIWLTVMNVTDRILQMSLLVIIAALLAPNAVGLLGIALLTLSAIQQFTFLGIDDALIQRKEENVDAYLNTSFVLEAARGLLMAAVVFLAAPLVAQLMAQDGPNRAQEIAQIVEVLRWIALSPILLGLKNPAIVYFRKNLEFHKQAFYSLSGSFVNFAVAVGLALLDYGVMSLVYGYVLADAVRLVVSYIVHDNRPGLGFELEKAKDLLNYGKWMTGTKILHFLLGEGDDIVVGAILGATSLGLYQVAYRIARAPATEITQIITRVMFPAFSKIQEDVTQLRSAFYKTIQISSFIAFPVAIGIITVAPAFVQAFLGDDWMQMVPAMQLIAMYGLLLSVTSTFGSVWKAVGRPDYLTKIGAIRLVVLAAIIIPMTRQYGITGTAAATLLVYIFPTLPLDVYLAIKSVEGSFFRLLREVSYPFVASAGMGLVVYFVDMQVDLWTPIADFFLLTLVGVVAYVVLVAVLELGFGWGMQRNLQAILTAVRD
jgi:O-antigen/teichoic acid export membrane protein